MSTNTQNDGKHRADEIFAARRRYVTQLCGFRRTGSFSRAEPGAFEEFDLWKKHKLLNEIIIGCSRLEAEEDNEDFPNQLLILIDQIEYINLRVSFGRFELLQVYNYLVKNPQMPGNPINEWRHICLDFVNEIADATSDRHLSRTSYVYAEYVSVYKRLLYAEVELEFGKGSHTQYIDCVKKSISEKGQGIKTHGDHPGSCVRSKQNSDPSQAVPAARPTSRDENERGQAHSHGRPNGGVSGHDKAEYDDRQHIRSRPDAATNGERMGEDRVPVSGMRERANLYAEPEYGPRQDTQSRRNTAPMGESSVYDRFPADRMGGRVHPFPEREPYREPQHDARMPTDIPGFRQRTTTLGEADRRESDIREMRNRMAGL